MVRSNLHNKSIVIRLQKSKYAYSQIREVKDLKREESPPPHCTKRYPGHGTK